MPWKMKRLHLIFIVFVLWGDTNGFPVWNRTSVVDWQARLSNTPCNQTVQLSTHVQPFELLSRGGGNANVKGSSFSSIPITSQVQTSSQTSGASLVYARPSSGSDVTSMGPGIPSSSQSVAPTNLVSYQPSTATHVSAGPSASDQSMGSVKPSQTSGRYTILQGQLSPSPSQTSASQSSNEASTGTQFAAGQSVSTAPAQTSGPSLVYPPPSSGSYVTSMGPGIPSSSQSAVSTNQLSDHQTVSSYQLNPVTQFAAGPSATAQTLGASYPGQTSGRYIILHGQLSPSPSQMFPFQVSNQPSTGTQFAGGQSVTTASAQSSGTPIVYPHPSSGSYVASMGPGIPSSSQSAVLINQASYQPNTPPQTSAGQPLTSQAPFSSSSGSSESVKWYTIIQPQIAPPSFQSVGTANQISGFQTQLSNQPSSASQVLLAQYAIAQSLGASYPSRTVLQGQLRPSPSQVSASQVSNQPSMGTQFAAGQSVSSVQAQTSGASLVYQSPSSGSYLTSMGPGIPSSSQSAVLTNQASYQPSTATLVSAGPSTTAQFMGSVNPSQTSGGYTVLHGQLSPSPSQMSASQASNQPSADAPFTAGQSVSIASAQSSDASLGYPSPGSYVTSMGLGIPSLSQSAVLTNQASYQPSTATQVSVGPSATAQTLGASYPSQTSGRYTVLQGQMNPSSSQLSGFQTHLQQPSATTWFSASQPASKSQAQSSGASVFNQSLTSGRYLTPLGAAATNQPYGSQAPTYQLVRTTVLPGQFVHDWFTKGLSAQL